MSRALRAVDKPQRCAAPGRLRLRTPFSGGLMQPLFVCHPQAMWVVSPRDLAILAINQAALRDYPVKSGGASGLTLFDLLDVSEHERLVRMKASRSHGQGSFLARGKTGASLVRVHASWTRCEWEGYDAMMWMLSDESRIETARSVAKAAAEDATTLLEHSPTGLCRYNLERDAMEQANGALARNLGLTGAEELRLYAPHFLLTRCLDAGEADEFSAALNNPAAFDMQMHWRAFNGATLILRIYGYPLQSGQDPRQGGEERLGSTSGNDDTDLASTSTAFGGRGTRFLAIENVTAQEAAKAEQEQGEKMQALGRLAATVTHDFNNILLVMRGYAEMLQRSLPAASAEGKQAAALLAAADSAAEVTAALVGYSRQESAMPQHLDLNELAREMSSTFFPTLPDRIHGRLALAPGDVSVSAPHSQVHRMLVNLLANARDAMPGGGTLTITTATRENEAGEPQALIEVRDTGTGMDRATQAKIFERFFTTKAPGRGTGLGLAYVQSCMTQVGGQVEVESELGKGTCFRLVFRGERAPVLRPVLLPHPVEKTPVARESKILLVDDQEQIRTLLTAYLQTQGYDVVSVGTGEAAIAAVAAEPHAFDALVTDVSLPGIQGDVLAREVQTMNPEIAVLLMSGHCDLKSAAMPDCEVVTKPFAPSALGERLQVLLRQPVA